MQHKAFNLRPRLKFLAASDVASKLEAKVSKPGGNWSDEHCLVSFLVLSQCEGPDNSLRVLHFTKWKGSQSLYGGSSYLQSEIRLRAKDLVELSRL